MAATSNIETIAYVVHDAKKDFKLEEIILGEMQDDELLIDMKYSGICHTDLVFQQGELTVCPYPAVFGHEGAGTIRAIGSKVKDKSLKVGDFVLLSMNYCEQCKFCKDGHPADCVEGTRLHLFGVRADGSTASKLKSTGESLRSYFFGQSSFAKTNFVHETCVVKFPYGDQNASIFAAMGCGYQTGKSRQPHYSLGKEIRSDSLSCRRWNSYEHLKTAFEQLYSHLRSGYRGIDRINGS